MLPVYVVGGIFFSAILLPIIFFFARKEDVCVTRLRHLAARDDWDPEVVKKK